MPQESTAARAPPRSGMCWAGATPSAPGSTLQASCGCSAAMATTQPGSWATSTTCGNTIRPQGADLSEWLGATILWARGTGTPAVRRFHRAPFSPGDPGGFARYATGKCLSARSEFDSKNRTVNRLVGLRTQLGGLKGRLAECIGT